MRFKKKRNSGTLFKLWKPDFSAAFTQKPMQNTACTQFPTYMDRIFLGESRSNYARYQIMKETVTFYREYADKKKNSIHFQLKGFITSSEKSEEKNELSTQTSNVQK